MTSYYNYNGQIIAEGKAIVSPDNRGLRYGDGLFETMKMANEEIRFFSLHADRLFNGLALLQFELPSFFTRDFVLQQVKETCRKNNIVNARIRFSVIRGNGGLYDPENHSPNFIVQCWPVEPADFHFNENGLIAGSYKKARKSIDDFANLKSNNYLCYAMAALHVKQCRWNEAILFNTDNNICDATIANVFLVKDGVIKTPALDQGCVAGVMRRYLLETLPGMGFSCEEAMLTEEDISSADEIFFTNAMQGIRWTKQCNNTNYKNELSQQIFETALKTI